MKKENFLKFFKTNLEKVLKEKKEFKSLSSMALCENALQQILTQQSIASITTDNITLIYKLFTAQIDQLAKSKQITGTAAHYSKTTFKRINLNLDPDNKASGNADEKSSADLKSKADAKSQADAAYQRRQELVAIFKETKAFSERQSNGLDLKLTAEMIKGTKVYHTKKPEHHTKSGSTQTGDLLDILAEKTIPRPTKQTKLQVHSTRYQVLDTDSFVAAIQLKKQGLNPLVLNMANAGYIGGGVEGGASAQEETLFRCSNYYQALYPFAERKGKKTGAMKYRHRIPYYGSIFTPNVQVFRDSTQNYQMITPVPVHCIAVEGCNLSKPHKYGGELRGKTGAALDEQILYNTIIKVEHICEVAILHGCDSLVLGAISCGAFRLPGDTTGKTAQLISKAFQIVFEKDEYKNCFKDVTFAVLSSGKDPIGKINFITFDNMVKSLKAKIASTAASATLSASTPGSADSKSNGDRVNQARIAGGNAASNSPSTLPGLQNAQGQVGGAISNSAHANPAGTNGNANVNANANANAAVVRANNM